MNLTPRHFPFRMAAALALLGAPCLRAQDADKGRRTFAACSVCHDAGTANKQGPGLAGIVGRASAKAPGFRYSGAMKRAKLVWDRKTLDAYLSDPQGLVPGNTMPFPGLPDAATRADLIAYLALLR